MKKLFAILLVIAMMIPFALPAQAAGAEKKPFYLVNWGDFEPADEAVTKNFTNTFYMPYIWFDSGKLKNGTTYAYAPAVGGSGNGEEGAKAIAQTIKDYFETNKVPAGARYINFTLPASAVNNLNDYCIVGKSIPVVSAWIDAFCKELKALGGELDGVTVDVEFLYIYSNYIHGDYYPSDKYVYKKIAENPEYVEKIRPMLVERGFKFYSPVTDETPEIFSIHPNSGAEYAQSRSIWNAVMRNYLAQTITEGCAPMWKYFPNAVLSDYQIKNADPWFKEIDDHGNINSGSGGSYTRVGNSSNDNFYCVRPSTSFFKDSNGATAYPTLPGYNNAVFSNTPYNKFLFDMNTAKGTYQAADADENGTKQVSWWLAHAYYGSASHNAYWSERIMHLCMLNPQIFLGYILTQDCTTDGAKDSEKYTNALLITDQVLSMASDMVGYTDMKPLNVAHNWNQGFVLSGAYANGRNVYRITPDTTNMKLEDFQVKDAKDLTFKINGTTVTFPGGKIVKDKAVYDIGTCGYWVETSKDVTPVITRGNDYYKEFAAYQETYEQYDVGTEYIYKNVTPQYTWEMKKTGTASSKIVADPTNAAKKMLAVTGNYIYNNVKMPDNIIGADTYAKHQAWEQSFILPADMPAEAEISMLKAIHSKNKFKDQGVKVAGGKLFFDNAGQLVELPGVTLAAGTKYTVVREFNFTDAAACTCNYYVYDANRTLLASVMKVPVPAKWELPIETIQFSTTGVSGNPVLFDDYKLYTTRVNADFYLYDAHSGMPLADMNVPHNRAVAYRFAWLNSTNTEKSYSLVAAYYDGETKVSEEVIKEMKLVPNQNGAFVGEIEIKQAGKSMLLYVRDNNPADDAVGTVNPDGTLVEGNGTEDGTGTEPGTDVEDGTGTDIENGTEDGTGTENGTGTEDGTGTEESTGTDAENATDKGTEPTTKKDDAAKTDKDGEKDSEGGNKTMLIIIIAGAAVVVAAAAVTVILILKKKKKAAAIPTEETLETEEAPAAEETPEEDTEE